MKNKFILFTLAAVLVPGPTARGSQSARERPGVRRPSLHLTRIFLGQTNFSRFGR